MKLVNRIVLKRQVKSTNLVRMKKKEAHLIQEFILTRLTKECEDLKNSKDERWIAHQRREGRDQAIEIIGCYTSCVLNAMSGIDQESL